MIPVKGRVHQMQKTGLKQLLFMGIHSWPLSYRPEKFNHYMRHTKTLLATIELAKVLATNAKVLSLLAL